MHPLQIHEPLLPPRNLPTSQHRLSVYHLTFWLSIFISFHSSPGFHFSTIGAVNDAKTQLCVRPSHAYVCASMPFLLGKFLLNFQSLPWCHLSSITRAHSDLLWSNCACIFFMPFIALCCYYFCLTWEWHWIFKSVDSVWSRVSM